MIEVKTKEDLLDLDVKLAVIESKFETWIEAIKETRSDIGFLRHKIHLAVRDKIEEQD